MQAAPTVSSQVPSYATPTSVGRISAGQQFVVDRTPVDVYALLTHANIDVRDARNRWCVVVATHEPSTKQIGEIVALDAGALVYLVRQVSHALYDVA